LILMITREGLDLVDELLQPPLERG
jgi:hypothetical protein